MPNQRSKRKRNTKQRRTRSRQGFGALGHIPPFVPTISLSHKFRFTNGSNSGVYTVTRAQMLNLLLYTPTAVTSVRLIEAIRLTAVEIWSNPAALGSASTSLTLEWLGENGPSTVMSDIAVGVTPAHIRTSPPRDSSCRWWSMSGFQETDDLFTLSLPVNCTIDVSVEMRLVEQESPTAGDIPAGASIGQLYGDYLDGLASAKLAPSGYTALP